ncbi:YARHG domain-containing protein [Flammeovirgaceae bacterium SG7u.111]|nr:YARHG domain-containing protein [Flammeovirgaceae bacterium SG7u.132]WPO34207.1 YARHG domain-containing protein [Flammeovirgaceae bacterium SG7u.111]
MKKTLLIILLATLVLSCESNIKNKDAEVVVEEGTEIPKKADSIPKTDQVIISSEVDDQTSLLGSWVGYFEKDTKSNGDKTIYVDEGYVWNRENKINISIDEIKDSTVVGHSVVAGNDRPFEGSVKKLDNDVFSFNVKEPGDDKYDGEFTFTISNGQLTGKWTAYKNIDIKHRKYTLEKKEFSYNPDIMLEYSKAYVDWNKYIEKKESFEIDENEIEEWMTREFASATNLIYEINASNKLLAKEEVENLKKGDLTIIRNTIYARHGYSFKNRPMRVFFDAQPWYIPIHTDIKSDFTDIEKQNIQLLLRYEKNASEYYDRFGRG